MVEEVLNQFDPRAIQVRDLVNPTAKLTERLVKAALVLKVNSVEEFNAMQPKAQFDFLDGVSILLQDMKFCLGSNALEDYSLFGFKEFMLKIPLFEEIIAQSYIDVLSLDYVDSVRVHLNEYKQMAGIIEPNFIIISTLDVPYNLLPYLNPYAKEEDVQRTIGILSVFEVSKESDFAKLIYREDRIEFVQKLGLLFDEIIKMLSDNSGSLYTALTPKALATFSSRISTYEGILRYKDPQQPRWESAISEVQPKLNRFNKLIGRVKTTEG